MTQPTMLGADNGYASLVDDLTYRFDGIHDRTTVTTAVEQARTRLEATATIPDFLPVLVARFAREQLTAAAQADGRIATTMPELLFVCVPNAGRSQLAAALAQQLSNGKVRRLRAHRTDQPAGHPGPRRTWHRPHRRLPQTPHQRCRPRRRRDHHHGLRRHLPRLPRPPLPRLGHPRPQRGRPEHGPRHPRPDPSPHHRLLRDLNI